MGGQRGVSRLALAAIALLVLRGFGKTPQREEVPVKDEVTERHNGQMSTRPAVATKIHNSDRPILTIALGALAVFATGVVRQWYALAYRSIGTTVTEVGLTNWDLAGQTVYIVFLLSMIVVPPTLIVYFLALALEVRMPHRVVGVWTGSAALAVFLVVCTYLAVVFPLDAARLTGELIPSLSSAELGSISDVFESFAMAYAAVAEWWIAIPLGLGLIAVVSWQYGHRSTRLLVWFVLATYALVLLVTSWLGISSAHHVFDNSRYESRNEALIVVLSTTLVDPLMNEVCVRWIDGTPSGIGSSASSTYIGSNGDFYLLLHEGDNHVTRLPASDVVLEPIVRDHGSCAG